MKYFTFKLFWVQSDSDFPLCDNIGYCELLGYSDRPSLTKALEAPLALLGVYISQKRARTGHARLVYAMSQYRYARRDPSHTANFVQYFADSLLRFYDYKCLFIQCSVFRFLENIKLYYHDLFFKKYEYTKNNYQDSS